MPITLSELAFASFVFDRLFDNGKYEEFQKNINGLPDLRNYKHREKLLKFLNGWGCRNIAKKYHPKTSEELKKWYSQYRNDLPNKEKNLWDLTESELGSIDCAFKDLANRIIATRKQNRRRVHFGFTAAAKTLFVLRPKALVMCDKNIRGKYVGKNGSYKDFLREMKRLIGELGKQCKQQGFGLNKLPERLNRKDTTIPKLIDEYNWITKTESKELNPIPIFDNFRQWAEWTR
jgi:hypothetical protein